MRRRKTISQYIQSIFRVFTVRTFGTQRGVTLFELLVAMTLLGLTATMIYSVLNVGITFSTKGENRIHALEQEYNFLDLLHKQVKSAWYDTKQKKVMIASDGDILRIWTRHPFLYRDQGLVFAVYRYDPAEEALYYLEKRDFYNIDYNEDYVPDFADMRFLMAITGEINFDYAEDIGTVTVLHNGREYSFLPRCIDPKTLSSI